MQLLCCSSAYASENCGEWPRYVGHVAETVAAQDFGTAGGSLHWDNAPRGIASNTLLLHYLPVQKQRQIIGKLSFSQIFLGRMCRKLPF